MEPTVRAARLLLLLLLVVPLAACEVIGDIFQAGVWVGVIRICHCLGCLESPRLMDPSR